jgi:hypothetical protein
MARMHGNMERFEVIGRGVSQNGIATIELAPSLLVSQLMYR